MFSLRKVAIQVLNHRPQINIQNQSKNFWAWLNIIFNKVDHDRLKTVGPERLCAEWLLKNGACIKYLNSSRLVCDYNSLPVVGTKFAIKEIEAVGASIFDIGFDHFHNCDHIETIKFQGCSYLTDEALKKLSVLHGSLRNLEIAKCYNMTDEGLLSLKSLDKLEHLMISELPYVKNMDAVKIELNSKLPNCKIEFNEPKQDIK